ncbi:hypothetical protein ABBQ38_001861 [Trebouxia sp. C0009 RCD-2024]
MQMTSTIGTLNVGGHHCRWPWTVSLSQSGRKYFEVKGKIAKTEQKLAAAEHAPNWDKDLLLSLNNQLLSLNNQVLSLNEEKIILLRSQAPSGIRSDADVARMRQLLQETADIKLWHEERKAGAYSVVTLARLWLEGLVHGYESVHDD